MGNAAIVYKALKRTEVPVVAKATIDIDEPIHLIRGEFKEVSFRYFPGDPPGDRFGMEFYLTEEFADLGENRLAEDLPDYQLIPHAPHRFIDNFKGLARFYVPFDWRHTEIYGKIILYQEAVTRRVPVGDPVTEDLILPQSPQANRVIPNWKRS